jgi:hypothetical protein
MDLIVLVADKDMRFALEGLLGRHESLRIRPIATKIMVHPRHDPGVLRECHDFLRPFLRPEENQAPYALVVFDLDGCGKFESREVVENLVEARLAQNGWADRSAAVVIDPELEVWVWSESPYVATALRWPEGQPPLAEWLAQMGYLREGQAKPEDPKGAVEGVLKLRRVPRSASIYRDLAEHVGFHQCTDPAFVKLRSVLTRWFPRQGQSGV